MGPSDPTLTHVRLLVDDYRACFEFYADVLGFEATFGDADSGYADFEAGGDTALALFDRAEMLDAVEGGPGPEPDAGPSADGAALVFGVEDVDGTVASLREAGVEVVSAPADRPEWGIRTAHVRDPAGTLIEFNEPL
jgi:catechol 2,3-dioxygenase-like lactoylglutathione lyase family enzyme